MNYYYNCQTLLKSKNFKKMASRRKISSFLGVFRKNNAKTNDTTKKPELFEPYITVIERKPVIPEPKMTREDLQIRRIESPPELKAIINDPMPSFTTVEQRLIDLDARKLHPYYKRLMTIVPKKYPKEQKFLYKSGGICDKDTSEGKLKKVQEKLQIKDGVDVPKQIFLKIAEIEQNRKPTLERKIIKNN